MPSRRAAYDAVIVGGGHNGLVCACYLAGAGLKVRVLERRAIVGGAAVTEEFHPGFRNSTASYTVSLLHRKIIADLRLADHGLRIVERPLANFLPLPDGAHLKLHGGLLATQAEVARFSRRDADRLPAYYDMLSAASEFLRALVLETPPNVGGGLRDVLAGLRLGRRFLRLTLTQRRDAIDLFAKSAGDVLDGWFEADPLKAAFGFDSMVGNFASPYTPGSAYVLLHHVFGEVNGKRGQWGHAMGGMGAITTAMASEARRRGVEISTASPVARVRVRRAQAVGVTLADGAEIEARAVVANVNPKLLYLKLMDEADLDADFLRRIRAYKCASGSFRMNVALSELPDFVCLPGKAAGAHHMSGIVFAPSLAYMERAYVDARASGWSRQPIVELLIPSTVDDSLAPAGRHVASLFGQHFNPVLPDGRSWDDAKDEAAAAIIDLVDRFAPNFKASILRRSALSPLDLEREFGLVGGDIFHGAMTLDQLYSLRPVLGHADYRGPLAGLYMCGAGTHPGGGVTGMPGHNAAREIVRDFRRRRLRRAL
ncbi:MAG: phytoene desaturase family protein [Pseudomonadota bacterium]